MKLTKQSCTFLTPRIYVHLIPPNNICCNDSWENCVAEIVFSLGRSLQRCFSKAAPASWLCSVFTSVARKAFFPHHWEFSNRCVCRMIMKHGRSSPPFPLTSVCGRFVVTENSTQTLERGRERTVGRYENVHFLFDCQRFAQSRHSDLSQCP